MADSINEGTRLQIGLMSTQTRSPDREPRHTGSHALLSAAADDLDTSMARIRQLAYPILDGTLIPIDRVHDHKPYYSGSTDGTG